MFSKKQALRIVNLFVSTHFLWTTSCTRYLDEKRETPQTIEMSNARFACLQSLPEEINQFLRGTVTNSDIKSGFTCAKDALVYFKNKTKGTYDDAYSMEDLRNFFGKYFLKKNNVTPEFGNELFKLKKVLLGGSEQSITKTEIQRLVEILDVVRDQAILLAPHMPTLLGVGQDPAWIEVDNATKALGDGLWALFKQVNLGGSDYTFQDLKKFMDGLDKFINAAEPFYLSAKLSDNVALVEAAKNVLIGQNITLDGTNDWRVAIDTVMGVYREALRYIYFLKGKDINSPAQLKSLMIIADDALTLLEQSLPIQRQGSIPFENIDALLDLLGGRQIVPMGLSAGALKETYKKVILRMLDPERRGDPRGLQGLERLHILAMRHEIQIYELHQFFFDHLKFDAQGTISFPEIKTAVAAFDAPNAIAKTISTDSLEQESIHQAWLEGVSMLVRDFPVFFNAQGREVVVSDSTPFRQSWNSLTKWNLMRALSRAMLLGYGNKHAANVSDETMIQSGLEQWYTDFNTIGVELKAFDPRNGNSGARSFKEANFFTSAGNGDNIMNYRETFDFVSLLISGGISSAESTRQDIVKTCALKDLDVFGYPKMNENCFQQTLRKNFAIYFNNLPGMVRAVMAMTDAQWQGFYGNLMSASRVSSPAGGVVETADLRTATMILHYTESLMSVYDTNHDSKLSMSELRVAAPRFLTFMKQVSPVQANFMVTDFFLFLVYKALVT